MATKVANKSTTERQWNSKIFFPKDNYVLRVTDQVNKPSSTGKPMTKLEFEIVNCPPKTIGKEGVITFDGSTFSKYYLTGDPTDAKADDRWFNAFDDLLQKMGIDTSNGWNQENPPNVIGKVVNAQLYGKEQVQRATPTTEEAESNDPEVKKGKILKDMATGKDAISYQIEVGQIYNLCTEEVRPF